MALNQHSNGIQVNCCPRCGCNIEAVRGALLYDEDQKRQRYSDRVINATPLKLLPGKKRKPSLTKRPEISPELKLEIARLKVEGKMKAADIAAKLGIPKQTVYNHTSPHAIKRSMEKLKHRAS